MRRREFLRGTAAAAGLAALGVGAGACGGGDPAAGPSTTRTPPPRRVRLPSLPGKPNVLFIAIDDMNDWAGFLNAHPGTVTPNLDALAARSLAFTGAYCSAPMCLPSRTALVWGRQPFTSGVYDHTEASLETYRAFGDANVPLMSDFARAGYAVLGAGKITHDVRKIWDDYCLTEFYAEGNVRGLDRWQGRYDPNWISPYDGEPIGRGEDFSDRMLDFGPSGVAALAQPDGLSATWTCEQLRREHERPFFLAYGSVLPHTPWRIPQEFLDLHPLDEVVIPEYRPDDLDDLGDYARDHIIDTHGSFQLIRDSGIWEEAVQAYQGAISYADWCVGRILDELAAGPHADNTIVVLWSDHGWHLGEKLHWQKFTLWERATRVPFLIHLPGWDDPAHRIDTPVSLLDVGPTLAELCGIELSGAHDGASLLPIVADPARGEDRPPLSTWRAGNHSVRQGPYRYIRYQTGEVELYDHRDDPGELDNLAHASSARGVIGDLDGFLPPST